MLLGNGVKRPTNGDVEKLVATLSEAEADEVLNDPVVADILRRKCKTSKA
jgi:hypothetical protein